MYFFISSSDSFRTPKSINKSYNSFCTDQCLEEVKDGKLQCKCGEDIALFDWSWENENSPNIKMSSEGKEVLFHPVYSSGTAAVRGDKLFQPNYHYYWEIKIISKLYGTDVMIGVGTSKMALSDWKFKFCSLLGIDSESWGYSYHGNLQHNKLRRKYGSKFGLGSIIGVHLDMCNGTLEYFLNRKSLGIAFKNLKGKELVPMVSSTAAQSAIRITCCMSKEWSLQMLSLNKIMKNSELYTQYKKIPGLTRTYDTQYFWMQPQPEIDEKKRLAELDDEVAVSFDGSYYKHKSKKFKSLRLISFLYDQDIEENDSDSSEIYNFGEGSSNGSGNDHSGSGSESELASEIIKHAYNESSDKGCSSKSEVICKSPKENGDSPNIPCKLCTGHLHQCKECIFRKSLEDPSIDCSKIQSFTGEASRSEGTSSSSNKENFDTYNISCKFCRDTSHQCNYCILKNELEDSDSDGSEATLII